MLLSHFLLLFHRQDITQVEITFIRGGQRPSSQATSCNGSPRSTANGQLKPQNLLHAVNGIERTDSGPSSDGSEPDLSDTDVFMQQLLAGDANSTPTTNFVTSQGSPQSQASPPVVSSSVPTGLRPVMNPMQGIHSVPASYPAQPISAPYPGHVASALPQRTMGGFQPAMSSTPTLGISNGQVPSQPYAAQAGAVPMNGM